MNKFYEQEGYTFSFGSFLLLQYSGQAYHNFDLAISEAIADGCSYVLAQNEDKKVLIGWCWLVLTREDVEARYSFPSIIEVCKENPKSTNFILVLHQGNLELIPLSEKLTYQNLPISELFQRIERNKTHYVSCEAKTPPPVGNLKMPRH